MPRKKILLGLVLLILGIIGIASLLTMEIQLPSEAEATLKDKFTADQIKLLMLINPTILLIVAVVVGTLLYQRVNLTVPIIEKAVGLRNDVINLSEILRYGVDDLPCVVMFLNNWWNETGDILDRYFSICNGFCIWTFSYCLPNHSRSISCIINLYSFGELHWRNHFWMAILEKRIGERLYRSHVCSCDYGVSYAIF